jgi:hypothetical protein
MSASTVSMIRIFSVCFKIIHLNLFVSSIWVLFSLFFVTDLISSAITTWISIPTYINWISYLIQKPGSKTETTFFIIGQQGTEETSSLLMLSLSYSDVMQYQMKATSAIAFVDSIVLSRIRSWSRVMSFKVLMMQSISTLIVSIRRW